MIPSEKKPELISEGSLIEIQKQIDEVLIESSDTEQQHELKSHQTFEPWKNKHGCRPDRQNRRCQKQQNRRSKPLQKPWQQQRLGKQRNQTQRAFKSARKRSKITLIDEPLAQSRCKQIRLRIAAERKNHH